MKTGKFKVYYTLRIVVNEREVPIDEVGDEVDNMADNNCLDELEIDFDDERESKEKALEIFSKIEKVIKRYQEKR